MCGRLCYIRLELKRALRRLPHILAGAAVLVILMGAAALLAGKLLYGGQAVGRIPVGVVLPEEDTLAKQAVNMIRSLESVKSLCDLTYMDEEEAKQGLREGRLYAVLQVPDGFVQDIMTGVNTPVTVIFPENAGVESRIFQELTDAGAGILGASQAGIYSGDQLLKQYGLTEKIPLFEREMNGIYLSYSLPRMDYFGKITVNGAGDVTVPVFYGISGFVLVLLLSAIPVSDLLKRDSPVMRQKLSLIGIGPFTAAGSRILGLSLLLGILTALAALAAQAAGVLSFSLPGVFAGILVCLGAAFTAACLFLTAGSRMGGILLLFVMVTVLHFLSGGFLPQVFLPEQIREAAPFLPSHILMEGVKMAVTQSWNFETAGKLAALIAGGWLIAAAAEAADK